VETHVPNIHCCRDGWNFLAFLGGDVLLHLICQSFGILTFMTMHLFDIHDIGPLTAVALLCFLSPWAESREH
jgi:hypothetical protein